LRWRACCRKFTAGGRSRYDSGRAGTLISAHPRGARGSERTFWLATRASRRKPRGRLSNTIIDLDGGCGARPKPRGLLEWTAVAVRDPHNQQVDDLLQCAGVPARLILATLLSKCAVARGDAPARIHRSLAAVAFGHSMLLALFLLMAVRAELVQTPVRPLR